jgi:enolase-phosphatase E1
MTNVQFILMDIEGTTTDIEFVHRILFPYSEERMPTFVKQHLDNKDVREAFDSVKKTVLDEDGLILNDDQAIEMLIRWIVDDRKHTALKQLQGMIWQYGFEQGDYQGHVYPDVPPALAQWKEQGIGLGIYSSGSVQAQKLLFGHSVAGDLTPYFSHYFDTTTGAKRDAASYQKIAETLRLKPETILFLSDIEAELDAASQAGFQVIQLLRPCTETENRFPTVSNFADIVQ